MTLPLLVLANGPGEAESIRRVLDGAGLRAETCPTLDEVARRMEGCSAVVMTEDALAGPAVAPLLAAIARQPPWSDLPFIVLVSPGGAGRRTETVETLGNAVLLERPATADSLGSAARFALRARRRQVAMRDLMDTMEQRVAQRT